MITKNRYAAGRAKNARKALFLTAPFFINDEKPVYEESWGMEKT
ncbi:hypothetical protein [Vibrio sp. ABG19]|nr:hypothetical protein [Vibrio sp. ABG19]